MKEKKVNIDDNTNITSLYDNTSVETVEMEGFENKILVCSPGVEQLNFENTISFVMDAEPCIFVKTDGKRSFKETMLGKTPLENDMLERQTPAQKQTAPYKEEHEEKNDTVKESKETGKAAVQQKVMEAACISNKDHSIEKSAIIDFESLSNAQIFSQIQPKREYIIGQNPIKHYDLNLKLILRNHFLNPLDWEIPIIEKFSIRIKDVEYLNINDRHLIIINQEGMLIYKWKLNDTANPTLFYRYFTKIIEIWKTKKERKKFINLSLYKKIPTSYFLFLVRAKRIPHSLINFLLVLYQALLISISRGIDKIFNSFLLYLNVEKILAIETFLIKEEICFLIEYITTKLLLNSNFELKEIPDSLNFYKKEEYLEVVRYQKNTEKNEFKFKTLNLRSIFEGKHNFYLKVEKFSIKKLFINQNLVIDDDAVYRIPLKSCVMIVFDGKINIIKETKLNLVKTFSLAGIERISKFRNLLFLTFENKITCLNLSNYDTVEETEPLDD
ncbi:hypothetical protein CDIK_0594 [Cucumispora dikerogammari]|nr:hypothetical protein CDIK_0594 [Cucumispora dikerogammari]